MILFAILKFHPKHIIKQIEKLNKKLKYQICNRTIFLYELDKEYESILCKFVINRKFNITDSNDYKNHIENLNIHLEKKDNIFQGYLLLKLEFNFFAIKYITINHYGNIDLTLCTNNTIFIYFYKLTKNEALKNIIICHYNEILDYYFYVIRSLKLVYNNKFSFQCFQFLYNSKLYNKVNIKDRDFFYCFAGILHDFSFVKLEHYFIFLKLYELIITKKYNITIKGASDVIDIKKLINNIINNSYNTGNIHSILEIILDVEKDTNENFNNTILSQRLFDFLKSYYSKYKFLINDYKYNLLLISNLKNIDEILWGKIKRLFSFINKIQLLESNTNRIETSLYQYLNKNKYNKSDIDFIIEKLINKYNFKNIHIDDCKIVKNFTLLLIYKVIYFNII